MNRRIADTLQFRQLQLEIRMLDQRLASLTSQIDASNRPRIVEDRRRATTERDGLVERVRPSVARGVCVHPPTPRADVPALACGTAAARPWQINQFVGSINELRKQVQHLEREQQTARYRDADIEYRRLLIEKKTRALAIEDLAKYHRAVDGCV